MHQVAGRGKISFWGNKNLCPVSRSFLVAACNAASENLDIYVYPHGLCTVFDIYSPKKSAALVGVKGDDDDNGATTIPAHAACESVESI